MEMKNRLVEIAAALSAIGGLSEPSMVEAKARLAAEKEHIEGALRASKPPKTQLRSALTRLQKHLSSMQALHEEVVQLEAVVRSRREALDTVRAEVLKSQAEVAGWTQQVRNEELATVAALAPPAPSVQPGGPAAAMPSTLLHWAAGFAALAPQGVGANFQLWLASQEAALESLRIPQVFSVDDGDDDEMARVGDETEHLEAEDDPYIASLVGSAEATVAAALQAAAPKVRAGEHPGASAMGTALLGFGKAASARARQSPYAGSAAVDMAAAADTAALANEALAASGDGLVEPKEEDL